MIRIAPIPEPAAALAPAVVPLALPARQIVLRQMWQEGERAFRWGVATLAPGIGLIDIEFGPFAARAVAEHFAVELNRAEKQGANAVRLVLRIAVRLREAVSLADLAARLTAEDARLTTEIDADTANDNRPERAPRRAAPEIFTPEDCA